MTDDGVSSDTGPDREARIEPSGAARIGDYLSILSGTTQNVVGIVIAAAATFAAQILISRVLGRASFGIVTVATQAAFVLSFLTRAGMDMAVLRDVAIEKGAGRPEAIRARVARAAAYAFGISAIAAVIVIALADAIRNVFSLETAAADGVVEAAALGLPFLALTNVWLGATRGLKIMRYTLYVFWAGQPLVWILFMVVGWTGNADAWTAVFAYSLSWAWAAAFAYAFWRRESRGWATAPPAPGAIGRLVRYAAPRAPASLFAQLLFWTDLFVVTRYVAPASVGVYSAALRAGQIVVLFLTSVNLMFSPYVADLHSRGERERLDALFKTLTRWTVAMTLPMFLVLAIVPDAVLRLFGDGFSGGEAALVILLAGQLVNVITGSVGFVLIMAGRTGWDLLVYCGSFVIDLALVFALAPTYGIRGAAIANAITFGVSNLVRLALVKRFVGIQPYTLDYFRLLAPAGIALAAMWGVRSLTPGGYIGDLAITGGVGLVVYAAAYAMFGLTPAERRHARALMRRIRPG